ncbi:phosphotriesterase [Streptomyces sp. NPDC058000]|uniref:phosphotriesterase family protein n=1 Tax=Streptomyces sp. NPDC058000 TaxID=3346299 RepID=UPI0036EA002D
MSIRTVLGDIQARELGRTDHHEHLFQVTPLLPVDELDDENLSGQEAASLRKAGIDAMVEATPIGLGRNPSAVARIAARTGLHIVLTTGAHREAHYPEGHVLLDATEQRMADRFVTDLTAGADDTFAAPDGSNAAPGSGIRAGLLKAGIGYWSISAFEQRVLAAVATAHRSTGASVMVHLEHGSAAFEVLDALTGAGVRADRIALAHIDRNPDPVLHAELADAGCYLGYDDMARHREWPDSALLECLARVAGSGGAERILLGGDVTRRTRYRAYGGIPGLTYLPTRFVPRLQRELGAEHSHRILVDNPARWLDRAP